MLLISVPILLRPMFLLIPHQSFRLPWVPLRLFRLPRPIFFSLGFFSLHLYPLSFWPSYSLFRTPRLHFGFLHLEPFFHLDPRFSHQPLVFRSSSGIPTGFFLQPLSLLVYEYTLIASRLIDPGSH
jgi:hypothetical protein